MTSKRLKDLRIGDIVVHPGAAHYLLMEACKLSSRKKLESEDQAVSVGFPEIWLYRVTEKEWEHYPKAQVVIFKETYVIRDGERYDWCDD